MQLVAIQLSMLLWDNKTSCFTFVPQLFPGFCGFILRKKKKYGEFEICMLDTEITGDIGVLCQEITLVKASLAWRTDLYIYLKCCMRINVFQNCFWDFLNKNAYFLQVGKPIHLKVKNSFVRKELKIRSDQYFLFYLVGISTIWL